MQEVHQHKSVSQWNNNQNANRLFHQADSSKVWHSHFYGVWIQLPFFPAQIHASRSRKLSLFSYSTFLPWRNCLGYSSTRCWVLIIRNMFCSVIKNTRINSVVSDETETKSIAHWCPDVIFNQRFVCAIKTGHHFLDVYVRLFFFCIAD